MGYESRLYVVKKGCLKPDKETGLKWCEVIATINLCKMGGDFVDRVTRYPMTDSFFYTDNGTVVEDNYGAPLREIPRRDMIPQWQELGGGLFSFLIYLAVLRLGCSRQDL